VWRLSLQFVWGELAALSATFAQLVALKNKSATAFSKSLEADMVFPLLCLVSCCEWQRVFFGLDPRRDDGTGGVLRPCGDRRNGRILRPARHDRGLGRSFGI